MRLTYCKGWFRYKKRHLELLTEDKAKKLHLARKLYVVLVGEPDHPHCFLEVRLETGSVGVIFLDELKRNYLDYSFQEKQGRMFLSRMVARDYYPGSDDILSATMSIFKPDGHVYVETDNYSARTRESIEQYVDVSPNWESIPNFGSYESISRIERT